MAVSYHLELQVTEQGAPFYPPVGSVEYLSPDNAGYDLKIVESLSPKTVGYLVPLGVKARMLRHTTYDGATVIEDCHFTLEPRSSIYKTGFMMANSRGIIDKSYRGQLMAPVITVGTTFNTVDAGTVKYLSQDHSLDLNMAALPQELKSIAAQTEVSTLIPCGTRLFQIIAPGLGYIDQVRYVDSLPETVRGAGGFGSTGLK